MITQTKKEPELLCCNDYIRLKYASKLLHEAKILTSI